MLDVLVRLCQGKTVLAVFGIGVSGKVTDDELGMTEEQKIGLLVIALVFINVCL